MGVLHGESRASEDPESRGIGLYNLNQRLELLYGDRYELKIHKEPESYFVQLILHLKK